MQYNVVQVSLLVYQNVNKSTTYILQDSNYNSTIITFFAYKNLYNIETISKCMSF